MASLLDYDSEEDDHSSQETLVTYPDGDILNDEYELVGVGPWLAYPDDDDSGDYVQVEATSDGSRSDSDRTDSVHEYGASVIDGVSSSESDGESHNAGYRQDSFVCSDSEIIYESSEGSRRSSPSPSVPREATAKMARKSKRTHSVIEGEDEDYDDDVDRVFKKVRCSRSQQQ